MPLPYFNESEGEFHDGGAKPGELIEVYDLKEQLRCIIQITEVYDTTLKFIPEKLWRGECHKSAEEFQKEHFACWKDLDITFDTPITASHFKLITTIN